MVVRKEIGEKVGWLDSKYNGSQDHEFLLRYTEQVNNIYHIPKVLYHWRKVEGSTAEDGESKNYAWDKGVLAIKSTLERRGIEGIVEKGRYFGHYNVERIIKDEKLVSIIIPIKDQIQLLIDCIKSIEEKTTYNKYEIIIVDNGSIEEESIKYLNKSIHTVIRMEVPLIIPI